MTVPIIRESVVKSLPSKLPWTIEFEIRNPYHHHYVVGYEDWESYKKEMIEILEEYQKAVELFKKVKLSEIASMKHFELHGPCTVSYTHLTLPTN